MTKTKKVEGSSEKPKPEKRDTAWYDDLCKLYQKTKIPELRNVLWEQVKLLIYGRIRDYINGKGGFNLKRDPELCQKLYQNAFFIFLKACEIWDETRKTKFLTFLGDILDQEVMNVVRLDWYHKTRDYKMGAKLKVENPLEIPPEQEAFEKNDFLEEIKILFENYTFNSMIEKEIVYTMVYGVSGDWSRLQRKSKLSIANFAKLRRKTVENLKNYVLDNCSEKQKTILHEMLEEK